MPNLSPEEWQALYIGVAVLAGLVVRKSVLHRRMIIALVFWQIMGFTVYSPGEIETVGRTLSAFVFIVLAYGLWVIHDRANAAMGLVLIGKGAFLWALLYDGDPRIVDGYEAEYVYKAGLNAFWVQGVVWTLAGYFLPSRLLFR